jgi:hypothetical protein
MKHEFQALIHEEPSNYVFNLNLLYSISMGHTLVHFSVGIFPKRKKMNFWRLHS